jgi:hypothetical protein
VLPAEVPDDGVRLSHLDVTWGGLRRKRSMEQ